MTGQTKGSPMLGTGVVSLTDYTPKTVNLTQALWLGTFCSFSQLSVSPSLMLYKEVRLDLTLMTHSLMLNQWTTVVKIFFHFIDVAMCSLPKTLGLESNPVVLSHSDQQVPFNFMGNLCHLEYCSS